MIDSALTNANILIVDDQEANIDVLAGLLEMQGYVNIETTTNPRQVASLLESFKPDLLLLDLMMPNMNGFEVMKQLKGLIPEGTYLPILVLTADITTEAKQRALADGANDFLTKPFDLTEVGLRIKNLLYTKYLHQRLLHQNQLLEQKVRERTQELEQANQELILSRDKAESSDRLKTAFIQNISHEIRTPLNGILGFSDLLVDPTVASEDKSQFVALIQDSSNRLLNTIEDYVNIALIVSGNMEVHKTRVNVYSVLKENHSMFKAKTDEKGLTFELATPEEPGGLIVETDLALFNRVLYHLLDNAIKFTHQGKITMGYRVVDGSVELFVKDTGIGVEEGFKDKIFEIFTQEDNEVSRDHEGSGLGLSIVRGLLVLLGGNIRLVSEKGEGSIFYFTLPL